MRDGQFNLDNDALGIAAASLPLPGGVVLRPSQLAAIAGIRQLMREGYGWILYALPTGGGKTTIFSHAGAVAADQGMCVAILVHRIELVRQVVDTFSRFGVHCGVIAAGEREELSPVQVCLINSLYQRVRRGRHHGVFRLVVIDEAHHAICRMWQHTVPVIMADGGRVVGVTATPSRKDGAGLDWFPVKAGEPPQRAFETLLCGPDVPELVKGGFLCPAQTYLPPDSQLIDTAGVKLSGGDFDTRQLAQATLRQGALYGDAIAHYRRYADGKPMLAFCTSIAHSRLTAEAFNGAGITAVHVDGDTDAEIRAKALAGLADGSIQLVTNCALFGEGIDVPNLAGVIILRPTASLALHRQMIGRAIRPSPGKELAVIIDHAGNCYKHGLYDMPLQWTLTGKKRGKGEEGCDGAPLRRCPECGLANLLAARECAGCGYLFPISRRVAVPETDTGELEQAPDELTFRLRHMSYAKVLDWAGGDHERLVVACRARGYKPAWVTMVLRERQMSL